MAFTDAGINSKVRHSAGGRKDGRWEGAKYEIGGRKRCMCWVWEEEGRGKNVDWMAVAKLLTFPFCLSVRTLPGLKLQGAQHITLIAIETP